jgi:hypothetical protein
MIGSNAFSFEKSKLKYEIGIFVEEVGLTYSNTFKSYLKLSQIRSCYTYRTIITNSFVLYISYNYHKFVRVMHIVQLSQIRSCYTYRTIITNSFVFYISYNYQKFVRVIHIVQLHIFVFLVLCYDARYDI